MGSQNILWGGPQEPSASLPDSGPISPIYCIDLTAPFAVLGLRAACTFWRSLAHSNRSVFYVFFGSPGRGWADAAGAPK